MNPYQIKLAEFLDLTEKLNTHAKAIHPKMDDNEAEQLETVQALFDKRQTVIDELSEYTKNSEFKWTLEDKQIIKQLKTHEDELQPLLNGLHQSFTTQMNRLSQTKQASKKYIGAYQSTNTGGSFFDKRK